MANLVRSAKSGNDWTQSDLQAYNIRVFFQDATTFFGGPLPQPTVRHEVLTVQNQTEATDSILLHFIVFMKCAGSIPCRANAFYNFIWWLLQELGYEAMYGEVCGFVGRDMDMQFVICGQVKHVKTGAQIIEAGAGDRCLLLVQEDKRRHTREALDPEPQLIASAIANFSEFNFFRVRALGQPALEELVIPGFTMTGTLPIFYKIPVTTALAHAVEDGQYPAQETVVYAHLPELPRPQQAFDEGMEPLDNRHVILSCFQGLRQFMLSNLGLTNDDLVVIPLY
ncbi:hypothetical protein JVT61DRAFT_6706 [Boletus reticuloceps]|uniref:Uncharacterized protein n=1 Tax=Boletus reticuloceps TaxID=495285 RepID=A0A8I2YIQ6_9AGAM|nr:hypothetical protein JVT61DRAFT_6706 [Boletus reticuloceps]